MAQKEKFKQPSLKDQLRASRRINDNILGRERAEVEEDVDGDDGDTITPEKMTKATLRQHLDEAGIEYSAGDNKDVLVQLLTDHLAEQEEGDEEEEEEEDAE